MKTETYIVKEGTRSAFWKYEYVDGPGYQVKYSFGRLGLPESSLSPPTVKPHTSEAHREKEVGKKIAEKLKKGYKLQSDEQVEKEQDIAKDLGAQNKIQRMEFVSSQMGKNFEFGKDYDSERGVVVEIINSWSKDAVYLFLTKTDAFELTGFSFTKTGAKCSRMNDSYKENFIKAVRKSLRDLAETVAAIVGQFAVLGTRKLSLSDDDDADVIIARKEVVRQVALQSSGIGEQVLMQFAALGSRKLDI